MKKPRAEEATVEADMLPVMNVMFLLIPALLLAMEFASMATIPVTAPRLTSNVTADSPPPTTPALEFKVMIGRDGFEATTRGGEKVRIPLSGSDHDYTALGDAARRLKLVFPTESAVTVTAESDIPMSTLVRTIDTLRGDDCKMAGWARGEQPGADCLFWSPVIESVG